VAADGSGPRVLIRSEQTNGHVSVIETEPGPGAGPTLHHHDFDEAFYVIEGELTFQLRDEFVTARPGEVVFAPRGVPHTFANLTAAPARQSSSALQLGSSATSRAWPPSSRDRPAGVGDAADPQGDA
jgi:quercetin dioxygenase-like cupin family protein